MRVKSLICGLASLRRLCALLCLLLPSLVHGQDLPVGWDYVRSPEKEAAGFLAAANVVPRDANGVPTSPLLGGKICVSTAGQSTWTTVGTGINQVFTGKYKPHGVKPAPGGVAVFPVVLAADICGEFSALTAWWEEKWD